MSRSISAARLEQMFESEEFLYFADYLNDRIEVLHNENERMLEPDRTNIVRGNILGIKWVLAVPEVMVESLKEEEEKDAAGIGEDEEGGAGTDWA